jgi:predicted tellurium resistance membrane protein TerC
MFELFSDPNVWAGLITLTILEIVLGIDNIVFITILASKLPEHQRERARRIGLMLAMGSRILFLFGIGFILKLTDPILFIPFVPNSGENAPGAISVKDMILIVGGLFLIAKATMEIHHKLEGEEGQVSNKTAATMGAVLTQIVLVDLVFSIDSVITAIGMVKQIEIMIIAVVISVLFMLAFVNPISNFVEKHPTVKMLALAFLILIGMNILADAFEVHIPKGYTYFAMGFTVFVEMLNLRVKAKTKPVHLRQAIVSDSNPPAPAPSTPPTA